jgi:hypothetical protein
MYVLCNQPTVKYYKKIYNWLANCSIGKQASIINSLRAAFCRIISYIYFFLVRQLFRGKKLTVLWICRSNYFVDKHSAIFHGSALSQSTLNRIWNNYVVNFREDCANRKAVANITQTRI